jgi:hypothetical protein
MVQKSVEEVIVDFPLEAGDAVPPADAVLVAGVFVQPGDTLATIAAQRALCENNTPINQKADEVSVEIPHRHSFFVYVSCLSS